MNEKKLDLYYRPTCPYCQKVLRYLDSAGIRLTLRNISENEDDLETLRSVGGKVQVPCLFIDGAPLYESEDIIAYLRTIAA